MVKVLDTGKGNSTVLVVGCSELNGCLIKLSSSDFRGNGSYVSLLYLFLDLFMECIVYYAYPKIFNESSSESQLACSLNYRLVCGELPRESDTVVLVSVSSSISKNTQGMLCV